MRYRYFLAANAAGAICWAGGTPAVVYFAGIAAEKWLSRFSWVALVVAIIAGIGMTLLLKDRTRSLIAQTPEAELGGVHRRAFPLQHHGDCQKDGNDADEERGGEGGCREFHVQPSPIAPSPGR
jgi:hypothetical protein